MLGSLAEGDQYGNSDVDVSKNQGPKTPNSGTPLFIRTPTARYPKLQKPPYSSHDEINSKPALYQPQKPFAGAPYLPSRDHQLIETATLYLVLYILYHLLYTQVGIMYILGCQGYGTPRSSAKARHGLGLRGFARLPGPVRSEAGLELGILLLLEVFTLKRLPYIYIYIYVCT